MKQSISRLPINHRRDFLATSAGLAAASWTSLAATASAMEPSASRPLLQPGDTVLFQGDSITDAGRNKEETDKFNQLSAFGMGYAGLAAAEALVSHPDWELRCYNRGISGNKVFQLADRWQADCLNLKPTLLSILIGVNDIWHKLNGKYDGTVEVYEKDYHALLARTKEALPGIKLVVCEPFVLKCGAVTEKWFPDFDEYRAAAKRVSDSAGARFVPYQAMFDRAIEFAPPKHWAADGVHPTPFGASLMAYTWLQTVEA